MESLFPNEISNTYSMFPNSAHSPSFPSLHLRNSSFSNPSLALPTSKLILQPFRCFTYVTAHSPTLLSLLLRHRIFTYVTWRAAHVVNTNKDISLKFRLQESRMLDNAIQHYWRLMCGGKFMFWGYYFSSLKQCDCSKNVFFIVNSNVAATYWMAQVYCRWGRYI